jgi:hypothetical protein
MKKPGPILFSVFTPPRVGYFAGESDGGGDPGGGGGDGGDGGGGGGDANTAILDFRAPDVDIAADFLTGKREDDISTPPAPGKKKEEKPAAAKKPDPVTPQAKPVDKTGQTGDPPVKQLREELAALKAERDELKTYKEKGDPKLAEVEASLKAKETEISEAKTRIADYERRLAMADPEVTKELRESDSVYDKDAAKFYTGVPELSQPTINGFVKEYNQLPFGKPEYLEARRAFEAKVNEALGGNEDSEHRKLERALNFIERTHEYATERPKIVQKLNSSALKLQKEAQAGAYSKQSDFVKDAIAKAQIIPEGIEKTDPYHPKLMLKAFMEVIPEEGRAAFTKDIPEFISRVLAGPKPRSEQDYAGMTPEQVRESQSAESEQHEVDRRIAADVMYNGLRALRLFPVLVKDWRRLREKLKEDVDTDPPDPTKGGTGDGNADPLDDIRNFKAPDLSKVNI